MIKIFFETVSAPIIPAMEMQARKNKVVLNFQNSFPIKKVQISPAAKKALYSPWFAIMALVLGNNSLGSCLKTLGPFVVHEKDSNQKKYKCKKALRPMSIFISSFKIRLLELFKAKKSFQISESFLIFLEPGFFTYLIGLIKFLIAFGEVNDPFDKPYKCWNVNCNGSNNDAH